MKKFMVLFIFCVITIRAFAGIYCVNSNAPTHGSGTSWQDPWKNFSEINTVPSNSIIYVAPGYYGPNEANSTEAIILLTNQNNIKIMRGDTTDLWDSEYTEVIFDGGVGGAMLWGIKLYPDISLSQEVYNIEVQGIKFQNFKFNGIQIVNADYINIHNCIINNTIGIDSSLTSFAGIFLEKSNNCTISSCIIEQSNNNPSQTEGIYAQGCTSTVIKGNNINLHHVIYEPDEDQPHIDGIHITYYMEQLYSMNAEITDNVIKNTGYSTYPGVENHRRSGIHVLRTNGNILIKNNVIIVPYGKDLINASSELGTLSLKIFNNTLASIHNPASQLEITKGENGSVSPISIKNNIIYKSGGTEKPVAVIFNGTNRSEITTAHINYNLYYNASAGNFVKIAFSDQTINWDDVDPQGTSADPEFVDIMNNNLLIQLSSKAKNFGIPLQEVAIDIRKIKRPYWHKGVDLGAYELPEAQIRIGAANTGGINIDHTIEAIGTYWKKEGSNWPISTDQDLAVSTYITEGNSPSNKEEWDGFHFKWMINYFSDSKMGHALYKVSNDQEGSDYFYIDLRDAVTAYNPNIYIRYDALQTQKKYYVLHGLQAIPIENGSILRIWEIKDGNPYTSALTNYWSNCLTWVNHNDNPLLIWGPLQPSFPAPTFTVKEYYVNRSITYSWQQPPYQFSVLQVVDPDVYQYLDPSVSVGNGFFSAHYNITALVEDENDMNIEYSPTNQISAPIVYPHKAAEDERKLDYSLNQNYPNPFNPTTKISFSIPKDVYVTLRVYDILGREIKTLVKGEYKKGSYDVLFDAGELSSGTYIYSMKAGKYSAVKKLQLLK